MSNITLVAAEKVPEIFCNRIKNRQSDEPIFVTSMSAQFHDNPILRNLMHYGSSNDTLLLDYFGHWHGVRPTRSIRSNHKNARDQFKENFRGSYVVMGPPAQLNITNSAIFNRSHIKAYAVGNKILSLGGVNCVPYSYDFIDVMLDFESEAYKAYLDKFMEQSGNLRKYGDGERLWLNGRSEVLIDYGRKGKSLILSRLLDDLEKEFSSAVLSSTYIPYGRLDNVLFHHQQKGRPVRFYTNHPSKFQVPQNSSAERFLQKFYSLKAKTAWTDNRPDKFNHLKAAIIEYPNSKVAYIGSHNLHELPVRAGTAEVCLRTTDDELIDQLEKFMSVNLIDVKS